MNTPEDRAGLLNAKRCWKWNMTGNTMISSPWVLVVLAGYIYGRIEWITHDVDTLFFFLTWYEAIGLFLAIAGMIVSAVATTKLWSISIMASIDNASPLRLRMRIFLLCITGYLLVITPWIALVLLPTIYNSIPLEALPGITGFDKLFNYLERMYVISFCVTILGVAMNLLCARILYHKSRSAST